MAIGLRIRLSDGNRSARTNRKLKCNSDKSESMMAVDQRQEMERLLRLQRDAFTASRPESMAMRKDRIKRAMALPKEHGSRSEEHTSELQSLMRISYAVFCLNKKKTTRDTKTK